MIKNEILEKIGGSIEKGTPSLILRVDQRGKKLAEIHFGKTYSYYDLASLTKIIFTVPSVMKLNQQNKVKLSDSVSSFLPDFKFNEMKLRELLAHSAGLTWWKPYYKSISGPMRPEFRWDQLVNQLKRFHPKKPTHKSVYSDLDFFYLGEILVRLKQKSLLQVWEELSSDWRCQLHFCVGNRPKFDRRLYAPTGYCSWRGKNLQGEVHDANTWALAGVAPHAGLFGGIDDLFYFGKLLRKTYRGEKKTALGDPRILRSFAKRAIPKVNGDFGLGFMKPSKGGSAGRYISSSAFGHLGFTGTSFWYDPPKDLVIGILSHRTEVSEKSNIFRTWRPLIHEAIYRQIGI